MDANLSETAARLRLAITRLSRRLRQHNTSGLTQSQLSALASIEAYGPIRLCDLAARERVGAPMMTRVVNSIEELGLLDRRLDAADRRSSLVSLNSAGQARLDATRREGTALLARQLAGLDPAQVAALESVLPVLEALVDGEV
ncbi:MAG: MarR family winged helix-turn-helix transcriptional regulator [Mycobacteriales bacterium]